MKKILSIFTALAITFCLSFNLLTYAVNEPVKDSKQTSINKSRSTIANALNVTAILVCGAVTSVVTRFYFYEKGYQDGRDDNWLSWKNVSNFAYSSYNILLPVLSMIFAYKILKGIVNSLATAIDTGLTNIGTNFNSGMINGMDRVGRYISVGLNEVAVQSNRGISVLGYSVERNFHPLYVQVMPPLEPTTPPTPTLSPTL